MTQFSSQANQRRQSSDLGKSRREKKWPISTNRRGNGILWVRARSRIARTRALFDRFSAMSADLETGVWSRVDLNWRPPLRLFIEKLSADLATNFLKIKAAVLQSAVHSLNVSLFDRRSRTRAALRNCLQSDSFRLPDARTVLASADHNLYRISDRGPLHPKFKTGKRMEFRQAVDVAIRHKVVHHAGESVARP
jgi:hypothetical protein